MALLRPRLRRWLQRRLRSAALAVLLAASVLFLAQPPDGRTQLALRFNLSRLAGWALAERRDGWIGEAAVSTRHDHGLRLATDVGFVIKTGYGTRTRLPEQLDAFARSGGDMLGEPATGFLVVGDWSGGNASDQERLGVDVVDAVALMLDARQGGDAGLGLGYGLGQRQRQHPRLDKYRRLQAAVAAGDEQQAQVLGQAYGWELDALKFIVGLELAFRRLPAKKWYLVLDDDTFLVRPSLELLLGHLDASQPQYLGNAVGDYKARFAHGGSAVVLSAEALRRLFARPDVVADAYRCSLDETWGDRLVATTLQRVGVHIRERYSHHFNGEAPELTRLRRDRLCSPIVSFHGLRQPGAMAAVGRALAGIEHPITWGQLWHLFSPLLPMERLGRKPALPGDHVGPRDEHTRTWAGLNDEDACRRRCERTAACLAWTLDPGSGDCHVSPWALVGWPAPDGPDRPLSGVNWERIEPLMQRCPPLPT